MKIFNDKVFWVGLLRGPSCQILNGFFGYFSTRDCHHQHFFSNSHAEHLNSVCAHFYSGFFALSPSSPLSFCLSFFLYPRLYLYYLPPPNCPSIHASVCCFILPVSVACIDFFQLAAFPFSLSLSFFPFLFSSSVYLFLSSFCFFSTFCLSSSVFILIIDLKSLSHFCFCNFSFFLFFLLLSSYVSFVLLYLFAHVFR